MFYGLCIINACEHDMKLTYYCRIYLNSFERTLRAFQGHSSTSFIVSKNMNSYRWFIYLNTFALIIIHNVLRSRHTSMLLWCAVSIISGWWNCNFWLFSLQFSPHKCNCLVFYEYLGEKIYVRWWVRTVRMNKKTLQTNTGSDISEPRWCDQTTIKSNACSQGAINYVNESVEKWKIDTLLHRWKFFFIRPWIFFCWWSLLKCIA